MVLIFNGSMSVIADKLMGIFGPDFSLDYYINQGKISYCQGNIEAFQEWCNCTSTIV